MGAHCSCVEMERRRTHDEASNEFDPARHGSRTIFGPSHNEDFLQKQRVDRKRGLKKQKQQTSTAAGPPVPLFQKTSRRGSDSGAAARDTAGAGERDSRAPSTSDSLVKRSPREPASVTQGGRTERAGPESSNESGSGGNVLAVKVASSPLKLVDDRDSGKACGNPMKAATNSSRDTVSGLSSSGSAGQQQTQQRKPKKNLFFMPD